MGGFGVIQRGPEGRKGSKPRSTGGSLVSRVVRGEGMLEDQLGKVLTEKVTPKASHIERNSLHGIWGRFLLMNL